MKFQPAKRDCLPTSKCHGAIYDPGKLPLRSGAKLDRARGEKVLYATSRLSDPRKVYFLQEKQVEASLDLSPQDPPRGILTPSKLQPKISLPTINPLGPCSLQHTCKALTG